MLVFRQSCRISPAFTPQTTRYGNITHYGLIVSHGPIDPHSRTLWRYQLAHGRWSYNMEGVLIYTGSRHHIVIVFLWRIRSATGQSLENKKLYKNSKLTFSTCVISNKPFGLRVAVRKKCNVHEKLGLWSRSGRCNLGTWCQICRFFTSRACGLVV